MEPLNCGYTMCTRRDCNHCYPEKPQTVDTGVIRQFATGATRDTAADKLDYEGFECPRVMRTYAEYMHENRKQSDGTMRDSDNWQKGIPLDAYMKSLFRHFMEVWETHRGIRDGDIIPALMAMRFNVNGYAHEVLKERAAGNAAQIELPLG
jgi:hypothetical protein